MLLAAVTKINSLHKKVADVNPKDLYPFMEELRELVIESERVADKLEDSISKKEEMLEDLVALAEDKLKRLESLDFNEPETVQDRYSPVEPPKPKIKVENSGSGGTMRGRITDLISQGLSDAEVASKLGISTTEVQIVRKLDS
jgi:predicted transcriptional regulator